MVTDFEYVGSNHVRVALVPCNHCFLAFFIHIARYQHADSSIRHFKQKAHCILIGFVSQQPLILGVRLSLRPQDVNHKPIITSTIIITAASSCTYRLTTTSACTFTITFNLSITFTFTAPTSLQYHPLPGIQIRDLRRSQPRVPADFRLPAVIALVHIQPVHHALPRQLTNALVMIHMQVRHKRPIHMRHTTLQQILAQHVLPDAVILTASAIEQIHRLPESQQALRIPHAHTVPLPHIHKRDVRLGKPLIDHPSQPQR